MATIDLSITATLVAAAYHAYRWFDDPSVTRALLTGLASGLALLAKFSAIGFLRPILIGFLLLGWSANRTTGRAWNPLIWLSLLAQTALFCAAALLVVWACWQICPVPPSFPIRDHYLIVDQFLAPGSFPNSAVNQLIVWTRESIPGWIDGFVIAANHAYRGHPAQFLFGEIRLDGGWWYYFPVAFVLKSTLPFLVLIALAAETMARQGFELLRSGSLFAVVAATAVLSVGICSDLNIGVRHVLPMYPFLAIAASSLFACRDGSFARGRKVVTAAVLFLVLHGIASLAAHPDYLAYFNEMGRGREHRLLSDSNLDWGQDRSGPPEPISQGPRHSESLCRLLRAHLAGDRRHTRCETPLPFRQTTRLDRGQFDQVARCVAAVSGNPVRMVAAIRAASEDWQDNLAVLLRAVVSLGNVGHFLTDAAAKPAHP